MCAVGVLFTARGSPLSWSHPFVFSSPPFSALLCCFSFDTRARCLITDSCSSFGLLAGKGFIALITVLMKKSCLLSVYDVVLSSSAYSTEPITFGLFHPAFQHVLVASADHAGSSHAHSRLAHLSKKCSRKKVVMVVDAPYHLQSDSSSDQDPTLVQSR